MVEEVEEFCPEVQAHIFPRQGELFDHGEISIDEIRTVDGNTTGVAELTRCGVRKAGWVNVLGLGLVGVGIAAGNLVRTLKTIAVATRVEGDARGIVAVNQGEGEAGSDFFDERHLPAAEQRIRHVAPVRAELSCLCRTANHR